MSLASGEPMEQISLISAQDASPALWDAADALQARCPDREDPLFSPQLARLIARMRPDTRLICAHLDEKLIAFWPLHLRPGGWARPIGGPFSDWHAPLIDPAHPMDPQTLLSNAGIAGITVTAFRSAPWDKARTRTRTGAHITRIGGDHASWLENQRKLYPKHFKKMRQKRRHVERDFKTAVFNPDDHSAETFATILRLKRAQYAHTGRHDVLAATWAQDFVAALRAHDTPGLSLRVASLYLDGAFAAGEIMICSQTVAHGWLTAYDPEFGNYSPGFLLVESILEDMPTRGQDIYDAGPGQDYYKKYYSNLMVPADQGVLHGKSASLAPARLLSRGWRGLENTLPQRAGSLMGKVRRRSDQILASEIAASGRIRGFAQAAARRADD
ncbi:MAG: GNAT family N-acetyltransferase [Hyphomonadaceae bacterium]|nr:GNAT family N-acetyltransferase [Hyphomonadaceae bacterium]